MSKDEFNQTKENQVHLNLLIDRAHNGYIVREHSRPKPTVLVAKDDEEVVKLVGQYVQDQLDSQKGANSNGYDSIPTKAGT